MSESAESRTVAAQRRAREAEERVIKATQKGIKWKILRFFAQPTTAAWTALFYILISSIGVIYSWAFYIRFDDIPIFKFFTTPDFLLSAFRDIKTLVIGVITLLVSLSILVYRVYNSSIYSAYKSDRDKYRIAQRARIKREAALLLSISLLLIFLTFSLWWTSSYFWPDSKPSPNMVVLHLTGIVILVFFAYCVDRFFRNPPMDERGPVFLLSIALLIVLLISAFLFWPDWSEHSISVVLLHLVSLIILVPFAYCFGRLFYRLRDEQESQIKWGGRYLVFILLVEGIILLPFLSGVDDSKAALEDEPRHARVTLRRPAPQATPLPDHPLLFLGTTSSFHFFYEGCEKGGNDSTVAQEQGSARRQQKAPACRERPFIVPTANIASLEFRPQGNKETAQGGLSAVVTAITDLNKTISGLNPRVKIGDMIFDATKVATAIRDLDANSKTNTGEIAGAIGNLQSVVASNPDGLVTAINDLGRIVQNLHISTDRNHCASGWRKVAAVGPFCEGEHDLLEEVGKECPLQREKKVEVAKECQNQLVTLDQFVNEINEPFTNQQPLLIGRTDITPLRQEKRGVYGSNNGLAQARAKWVRNELGKNLEDKEQEEALGRAILLSAGPLHVGKNVSDCDRALDRSVEVYACWTPKNPEQASTPADSPRSGLKNTGGAG